MRQSVCLRTESFILAEGATVSPESIRVWVLTATTRLLPTQSKTRAVLVAAAIRCARPNLAQLGRGRAGPITAKSAINRAGRFTCNQRIEVADARAEVIAKPVRQRKERLSVSCDGTEFRRFHTLMAAACIQGRSVPLLWASYPEWQLLRSQNSLEEGLLRPLRTLIPATLRVVIRADRGFGRAEWAAACPELEFDDLVRIKPDVTVASRRDRGVLGNYPVFPGIAHGLPDVQDRAAARGTHHVVIRGRPGRPQQRDQPWYLMTHRAGRAEWLCQLYGSGMPVEELFRDQKDRRKGGAWRTTRLRHADRFDRSRLIWALAYRLVAGLGLQAKLDFEPTQWGTTGGRASAGVSPSARRCAVAGTM